MDLSFSTAYDTNISFVNSYRIPSAIWKEKNEFHTIVFRHWKWWLHISAFSANISGSLQSAICSISWDIKITKKCICCFVSQNTTPHNTDVHLDYKYILVGGYSITASYQRYVREMEYRTSWDVVNVQHRHPLERICTLVHNQKRLAWMCFIYVW